MENFEIAEDIQVYCIKAKSFPEGTLEAHQQLHSLIELSTERNYYGISSPTPPNSEIVYKAAVTALPGEDLSSLYLEIYTIKAGKYCYFDIPDFMNNIPEIETSFSKLIQLKNIDPEGACVEWYKNDDSCRCMVRVI